MSRRERRRAVVGARASIGFQVVGRWRVSATEKTAILNEVKNIGRELDGDLGLTTKLGFRVTGEERRRRDWVEDFGFRGGEKTARLG